jgi:hypothetical protein
MQKHMLQIQQHQQTMRMDQIKCKGQLLFSDIVRLIMEVTLSVGLLEDPRDGLHVRRQQLVVDAVGG